jgi:TIR domain
MSILPPKVFVSYSHDSIDHKDWVLKLATRLRANGIDVTLDQWDVPLGGDLPKFMEDGLIDAKKVLAVCSETYVNKANAGKSGVGYEKMILSAVLMRDISDTKIIAVIRNNAATSLPTFLGTKRFVDFREDLTFEERYQDLERELHGVGIIAKPPIGPSPFAVVPAAAMYKPTSSPSRYVSPSWRGVVTFDHSNNNGLYIVGAGDYAFDTKWSSASDTSIHIYDYAPRTHSVCIADGAKEIAEINDASIFDTSSHSRNVEMGEIALWQNTYGYYLATKVTGIKYKGRGGSPNHEVSFSYVIAPNKSASFSNS